MFRSLCSLVLSVCLITSVSFAGEKPVKGSITKIEKDKDKVVLVVDVAEKKKGDASTTAEKNEKKYTITSTTKIEKVSGKKDSVTRSEAKLDDLKEGQHIALTVNGDKVEKVEINGVKKAK